MVPAQAGTPTSMPKHKKAFGSTNLFLQHLLVITDNILVVNCLRGSTTGADLELLHFLKIPSDLENAIDNSWGQRMSQIVMCNAFTSEGPLSSCLGCTSMASDRVNNREFRQFKGHHIRIV